MADADDVRRLATALPGVVEIPSAGFDFRVAGKIFALSNSERAPAQITLKPGEPFNRALTKIWLGDHPIQADLKKAMLGG